MQRRPQSFANLPRGVRERRLITSFSRAALDRYEREVTAKKKGEAQERTRIRQRKQTSLAGRSIASVRRSDIAAYRDARLAEGRSGSTAQLELALLSNLYTIATRERGMVGLPNPVRAVRKPKAGRARNRRCDGDEKQRLLQSARDVSFPWLALAIEIALETGMRLGEILALRWRDVELTMRTARLRDTTSGEDRTVPLSTRALAVLETTPRSLDGHLIPANALTSEHAFRRACTEAQIENLRFHDLRQEATSRFFERGRKCRTASTFDRVKDG